MMSLTIENFQFFINLFVSLAALLIAIVALIYTVRTYLLKSGHSIKCDIGMCSSIDCNDKYVHHITLENVKDKSSVIFKIYLRIGYNIYLLLDDFEDCPLVLKPFEVYHKKYDPILFYNDGVHSIELNHLLMNDKNKRKVILSTTDGKYEIKTTIKKWDTISEYFENYTTLIVRPTRVGYKGKSFGSNIKYLVVLKLKSGEENLIPIHEDIRFKPEFKKFDIPEHALINKDELHSFLLSKKYEGEISFKEIIIYDYSELCQKERANFKGDTIVAVPYGRFDYYVRGRTISIWYNCKEDFNNSKKIRRLKEFFKGFQLR